MPRCSLLMPFCQTCLNQLGADFLLRRGRFRSSRKTEARAFLSTGWHGGLARVYGVCANPLRYFVSAIRAIYLKASSFSAISWDFFFLCVFAVIFCFWAVGSYRKRWGSRQNRFCIASFLVISEGWWLEQEVSNLLDLLLWVQIAGDVNRSKISGAEFRVLVRYFAADLSLTEKDRSGSFESGAIITSFTSVQ